MIEALFKLRHAIPSDVISIARLVEVCARNGEILPRSEKAIRESISNWVVVSDEVRIVACGSLLPYTSKLVEIRSLVVDDSVKRNGIGTMVVQALITKAHEYEFESLFALTRVVPFFEQLGFNRIDKATFPEKIWRDCWQCPVQENCDEQAVALQLSDLNTVSHQPAFQIQGGRYASVQNK
jgi:N-acetylglutamate synthase-like GNAT family acetyltransferase